MTDRTHDTTGDAAPSRVSTPLADVDIRILPAGSECELVDGRRVVVTDNPADGIWLICEPIGDDSAADAGAEMVMFNQVVAVYVATETATDERDGDEQR